MERLYFDYNATAPLAPEVKMAICRFLDDDAMNASSAHYEGQKARALLEDSRFSISRHLGCDSSEILFTSGATEGNNAVFNHAWQTKEASRDTFLISAVEHDSILSLVNRLKSWGAVVKIIPVNNKGELDIHFLKQHLDSSVIMISVMLANNETGIIHPLKEISTMARNFGVMVHTDAASSIGKMSVNFNQLGVDFLTLSGHKFHAPSGIGILVVKKGIDFYPYFLGGLQEASRRAGTENLLGIVGIASAMNFVYQNFEKTTEKMQSLRMHLKEGLKKNHPDIIFHEKEGSQIFSTLNVSFPNIKAQILLTRLDIEGVSASHGSACHSGSIEPSKVLLNMGFLEEEVLSTIRLSFGKLTTLEEVDCLLKIFQKIIPELK